MASGTLMVCPAGTVTLPEIVAFSPLGSPLTLRLYTSSVGSGFDSSTV